MCDTLGRMTAARGIIEAEVFQYGSPAVGGRYTIEARISRGTASRKAAVVMGPISIKP